MGPKRKPPGAGRDGPSKKQRVKDSPLPALTEEEADKTEVPWALPTQGVGNNDIDQTEAVKRYAPALYERPWAAIRTTQRPFKFPALRTPLYKAKGNDLDGTDPHKSSAALRDLFNAIKHATEQLSEDDALIYTRRAFDHAFANASDSSAVVASRSTAHPILALNRDYRVEV
jgi:hypothetical protein